MDATWLPLADTPIHPEYPCAHRIMAASIASVAEAIFGTAHRVRLPVSVLDAIGQEMGRKIGKHVVENVMPLTTVAGR